MSGGEDVGDDGIIRRLVRDQWVRWHGTPRVTVLAGGARARALWEGWLAAARLAGRLLEDEVLDTRLRAAVAHAVAAPHEPVAICASVAALTAWRRDHDDRIAAMVDEGWLAVPEPAAARPRTATNAPASFDARSAAEAALFDALEATPATAGRFRLNESLSVWFGSRAAEVDLLARAERIAVEIDGHYHFTDLDAYRRDRSKDLLLQTQGLLVVRVLAEDVLRDPRDAVATICRALAHRREEP